MADGSSDLSAAGYRAFISYSHKDTAWAKWLLARLEGYKLRADLLPVADQPGKPPATRLGKFFRDRDEAGAATNLADEIRAALARSEHMIVVASPASAKSPYVEQEIREFAALNAKREKPGNILTFIVAGEPNVSGDDERAALECFPKVLRGGLTDGDGRPLEPLAADARSTGDGRTRALAKIVSGLTGIRYDSLVRRDLQRRRFRQLMAAGIAAAVLATAAAVGWQMESDRREKAELETGRRTLAAVNDAERAQRFLNRGNVRRAVELAKGSLVLDGSLPFIPQAYAALYGALLQRGKPIDIEISVSYEIGDRSTYSIGKGEYLTVDGRGQAVIWSPQTGITYSRGDIARGYQRRQAQSADAVILRSHFEGQELRYWPSDRSWDKIDFSNLGFEGGEPMNYTALSSSLLVGCALEKVIAVQLPPKGDGVAKVAWTRDLAGQRCATISLSERGTILVGTLNGEVIELRKDDYQPLARYQLVNGAKDWVLVLEARNGLIAASTLNFVAIFRQGRSTPLLEFKVGPEKSRLAPDGRHVIQSAITGDENLIIHDLATGTKAVVKCVCTPSGYNRDGDVITLDNNVAVLRRVGDGAAIQDLFVFPRAPNELTYLEDGNFLLAERNFETETIVPLDGGGILPLLSGSTDVSDFLVSAAFFDKDTVALVTSRRIGEKVSKTDASLLRRKADGSPEIVWKREGIGGGPTGLGQLEVVGQNMVMIARPDSLENFPMTISIVDPAADQTVYEAHIFDFDLDRARGHLVLDTDDDLLFFDLKQRKATKIELPAKQPLVERLWISAGDTLYAAADNILKGVALDGSGALRDDMTLPGTVRYLCYAAGQNRLFALTEVAGKVTFSQWSLHDRRSLSTQDFAVSKDNEETVNVLAYNLGVYHRDMKEAVSCDDRSFEIRGSDNKAVRWDVAAGTITVIPTTRPVSDRANSPVEQELWNGARMTFDTDKVMVWGGDEDRLLARFDTEYVRITKAIFLHGRGLIAAGLENGGVTIWSLAAPEAPLIELRNHPNSIWALDASPDESELLTADNRGTVYIWPLLEPAELIAMADAKKDTVKSELTPPRN